MGNNKNIYHLFTPSGCLSVEGLQRYHTSTLPEGEKSVIKKHLDECELCRDALEGLALITDPSKLNTIVNEINKNLQNNLPTQPSSKSPSILKQPVYILAAASVALLIGIFFYFNSTIKNNIEAGNMAQEIKVLKKEIPPMPGAKKGQKSAPKIEVSDKSPEPYPTVSKNKKRNKEKSLQSFDTNINKGVEPSLKEITQKIKPSISEPDAVNEKDMEVQATDWIETAKHPVDIASTQPIEYFLAEIIVSANKLQDESDIAGLALSGASSEKSYGRSKKGLMSTSNMGMNQSEKIYLSEKEEEQSEKETSSFEEPRKVDSVHFFTLVENMPEFPGGPDKMRDYFSQNLKFPKEAKNQNIKGRVVVSFIINENGAVTNVSLLQGIGGGCDDEAIRVVESMPDWQPATMEGEPVNVLFTLPIRFKLL